MVGPINELSTCRKRSLLREWTRRGLISLAKKTLDDTVFLPEEITDSGVGQAPESDAIIFTATEAATTIRFTLEDGISVDRNLNNISLISEETLL